MRVGSAERVWFSFKQGCKGPKSQKSIQVSHDREQDNRWTFIPASLSSLTILFEPSGIWPLKPNCKIADFPIGTQARTLIEQFTYSYSTLLNALHETFNGDPSRLDAAIGMMYDLRVLAAALMQTDAGDGSGLTVGPSYEFVGVQGGI